MIALAIFDIEQEAIDYAELIHNYLTINRPRYNAIKWADPVESSDGGEWWVKQPIEEFEDKWPITLDSASELASANITDPLPTEGQILIDKYYLYKGDILKCRQTHNRTIYDPKDTPALFSYFRENSNQLQWIENEQVEIGWVRIYEDVKYEVIQAHQTQADWTPDSSPTLWKVYVDMVGVQEFVQPTGGHGAYNTGDKVLFEGDVYESLIDANVWSPTDYPQGWNLIN